MRWDVYENNGGYLFLTVMDDDYRPIKILEGWEYTSGSLADAIEQLKDDSDAWKFWDGDLMERLNDLGVEITLEQLRKETVIKPSIAICWGHNGKAQYQDPSLMGYAARSALNLPTEIGHWNGEAWDCSDDDEPTGSRMLRPIFGEEIFETGHVEYPIIGFNF